LQLPGRLGAVGLRREEREADAQRKRRGAEERARPGGHARSEARLGVRAGGEGVVARGERAHEARFPAAAALFLRGAAGARARSAAGTVRPETRTPGGGGTTCTAESAESASGSRIASVAIGWIFPPATRSTAFFGSSRRSHAPRPIDATADACGSRCGALGA